MQMLPALLSALVLIFIVMLATAWAFFRRVDETARTLDEARMAAEEASEAKTRLLHIVNHEVRTPLNAHDRVSRRS